MSRSALRPARDTIPLERARALVDGTVKPIDRWEPVPLAEASGRVLVRDVTAERDVPPFARAAMDGYAVVAEDTLGASRLEPRTLTLVETIFTGQMPARAVAPGTCAGIATGAPVPEGADAVVMVEDTERADDDAIRVCAPVHPRQNVSRQGADIARGQVVQHAGDLLTPSRVGAIAALGTVTVDVFARPRVALLSTGNEIVDPGRPLGPGQIYDVNTFTLGAIIREHGGVPVSFPPAEDNLADLDRALDACLSADLVVLSGGSSVGERDLIVDELERRGEVLFHGIAIKPGKPTAFGVISGTPVFGMPGNPTSCLSNAYILLVPALRKMARLPEHRPRTVRLPISQRILSPPGRYQVFTVRIADGQALPAFKASGDITSMSMADGYIEIPAQTDIVDAGEMVDVRLF
jgi:molybdenum cofactor synthesis domain-containing protein